MGRTPWFRLPAAELAAILKEHYSTPLPEENGYITWTPGTAYQEGDVLLDAGQEQRCIEGSGTAETDDKVLRKQLYQSAAMAASESSIPPIDLGKLAEDPDGFLRKQLCLLVNERVPNHLLGATIRTVDSSPSRACIEVHVTGASDPFRIAAARLWEHGLTVDKCVEMFHGKIRAQMPDNPDEAIAAGWTWHPVVGWQAP